MYFKNIYYIVYFRIHLLNTQNWKTIAVIEGTKAYHLDFSPKGTYLCSWEPFIVNNANPQGSPNLNIYLSETGSLVKSFIQKKQTNWEPKWTTDEKLFSRLVNTDVTFYEGDNFDKIVYRINAYKVASFSVSPMTDQYFVLLHSQGNQGQPSLGRYKLLEN